MRLPLGPIRYLVFGVVAVVVAAAIFFALNVFVALTRDASTGAIERWIVNSTCTPYELEGTVRNPAGTPVPFAVVEVAYAAERLVTRSGPTGSFKIAASEDDCEAQPREATVTVVADGHRPQRQAVPFGLQKIDVVVVPNDR